MATAKPAAVDDAPADAVPVAPKKGKKKMLIIVIVAVLLLMVLGGGAAVVVMKKKAAQAAELSEDGEPIEVAEKPKKKAGPPTFVPLDPFTVNLADKDADRFAQIAVTLQIVDAQTADRIKLYMPAIRNNILMVLGGKTSTELLDRAGKEAVSREILRECLKAMDVQLDAAGNVIPDEKGGDEEPQPSPIEQVLFANFIIQ
jgi:flagellar FliL protein